MSIFLYLILWTIFLHTDSDIKIFITWNTNLSDDSKSCRIHSHRSNPRIESESNGWFFLTNIEIFFFIFTHVEIFRIFPGQFSIFRLLYFLLLLIFFKRWIEFRLCKSELIQNFWNGMLCTYVRGQFYHYMWVKTGEFSRVVKGA